MTDAINTHSDELYNFSGLHGKYALEHRVIVNNLLGRDFVHGEVIHHMDLNPTNNSPENFIVPSNHDHVLLHKYLTIESAERTRVEDSHRSETIKSLAKQITLEWLKLNKVDAITFGKDGSVVKLAYTSELESDNESYTGSNPV